MTQMTAGTRLRMMLRMVIVMMVPWVSGQRLRVDNDVQMMNREPFILKSGELYRDVLTITTSQLAAVFARRLAAKMRPGASRRKGQAKSRRMGMTPRFAERSQMSRKGRMMPDEEIFDFTDSRFLQPPEENMKNFPEVNLVSLGGQTFVTPAPMDRESPRSPGHLMSPHHPMSAPETESHSPRRRFRPTPQPIFHVTMQTVMDHVSQLPDTRLVSPDTRHVSQLLSDNRHVSLHSAPDTRHVSKLPNTRHVSHSSLDTRHVSALPQVTPRPAQSIFGALKPFVNLGSGPPGHQLPGPVRSLRPRRHHKTQGLGYGHAWRTGYR